MVGKAYAKINLFLDISGILNDGYHSITSIMQKVSLFDVITVDRFETDDRIINITSNSGRIPLNENNLVYKISKEFFNFFGIDSYGINIDIKKHIPVSAGLGGGSSDAATVLKTVNRLFGVNADYDSLCKIAIRVGSDIPFCLCDYGTAKVEGKGDIISKIENRFFPYCVLVKNGQGMSSKAAYDELDTIYEKKYKLKSDNLNRLITGMGSNDQLSIKDNVYNIFENMVFNERPFSKKAKEIFLENDALFSILSGSGPTVLGFYTSKEKSDQMRDMFKELGYMAYNSYFISNRFLSSES